MHNHTNAQVVSRAGHVLKLRAVRGAQKVGSGGVIRMMSLLFRTLQM